MLCRFMDGQSAFSYPFKNIRSTPWVSLMVTALTPSCSPTLRTAHAFLPPLHEDINFDRLMHDGVEKDLVTSTGCMWGYKLRAPSEMTRSKAFQPLQSRATKLANSVRRLTPRCMLVNSPQQRWDYDDSDEDKLPDAYFLLMPHTTTSNGKQTRPAVSFGSLDAISHVRDTPKVQHIRSLDQLTASTAQLFGTSAESDPWLLRHCKYDDNGIRHLNGIHFRNVGGVPIEGLFPALRSALPMKPAASSSVSSGVTASLAFFEKSDDLALPNWRNWLVLLFLDSFCMKLSLPIEAPRPWGSERV